MSHKPSLLLYIHGFNSSPQSHKATVMRQYCSQYHPQIKVLTPQLPSYPQAAAQYLVELIKPYQNDYQIGLVGSSLGGYLATWLNAQFGYRTVLINPAVKPYQLLQDLLGEQSNPYTGEHYQLEEKHIQELKALDVEHIQQSCDFWLLLQNGDEVLDYQQAVVKYQGSLQTVEEGGDHSFIGFERYLEPIIAFLQLS